MKYATFLGFKLQSSHPRYKIEKTEWTTNCQFSPLPKLRVDQAEEEEERRWDVMEKTVRVSKRGSLCPPWGLDITYEGVIGLSRSFGNSVAEGSVINF